MIVDLENINLGRDDGFLLVRVGSDSRPATSEDIKDIEKCISEIDIFANGAFKEKQAIVTHHNIDMQWIDCTSCPPPSREEDMTGIKEQLIAASNHWPQGLAGVAGEARPTRADDHCADEGAVHSEK